MSLEKARLDAHICKQTSTSPNDRGMFAFATLAIACDGRFEIQGTVDHKTITSVLEDTSYTVLINSDSQLLESRVLVKFDNYREDFTLETSAIVVTDVVAAKLQSEFSEVRYFVNVTTEVGRGTTPVQISREMFNSIGPGLKIRLATTRKNGLLNANSMLSPS